MYIRLARVVKEEGHGVTARLWVRHIVKGLAVTLVAAAIVGYTYEEIGRRRDSQHPFRIGQAVDIGGRSLNINCAGSGSPAVILESGGGGYGGYSWRKVQSEVAEFTTVCWYDRAGEGWSDPMQTARSSTTVVQDLHELLQRSRIGEPYVMVGHSIGGEYVRVFTAEFPTGVAGVVLVDSTHPEQREPPVMTSPVKHLPVFARRLLCSALPVAERLGVIRFFMRNTSVYVPPQFSSEQSVAERAMRNQRVKAFETEATQGCEATDGGVMRTDKGSGDPEVDGAAMRAGNLGDRPLIVLTAGEYWRPDDPKAAQEIAEFHETWIHQLQPELARLSTNGKQIMVANSDHGIPEEAPGAIVNAVQDVVLQVRKGQK